MSPRAAFHGGVFCLPSEYNTPCYSGYTHTAQPKQQCTWGPAARSTSYTQMAQPTQQCTWGPAARRLTRKWYSQSSRVHGDQQQGVRLTRKWYSQSSSVHGDQQQGRILTSGAGKKPCAMGQKQQDTVVVLLLWNRTWWRKRTARKPSSVTTYVPFAGKRLIFSCRSRVVQKGTASAQQTPRRPCSKHGNLLPVLATQSLQEKDMSCIQARP